jgi:hypothetical protein
MQRRLGGTARLLAGRDAECLRPGFSARGGLPLVGASGSTSLVRPRYGVRFTSTSMCGKQTAPASQTDDALPVHADYWDGARSRVKNEEPATRIRKTKRHDWPAHPRLPAAYHISEIWEPWQFGHRTHRQAGFSKFCLILRRAQEPWMLPTVLRALSWDCLQSQDLDQVARKNSKLGHCQCFSRGPD